MLWTLTTQYPHRGLDTVGLVPPDKRCRESATAIGKVDGYITPVSSQRSFRMLSIAGAVAYIHPNDQWTLHRFYRPSVDLTAEELIAYRQWITEIYPSLPHRAGRVYAKLKRGEWYRGTSAVMPNGRYFVRPKRGAAGTGYQDVRQSLYSSGDGGDRERVGRPGSLSWPSMRVPHLHAGFLECFVDRGGVDAELLADRGEGVALGVELLCLFGELRGQLLTRTQLDTATAQIPGDRMAIGSELAGQRVRGFTGAIELQRLVHLIRGQSAGHTVVAGCYLADLRRCRIFPVPG